MNSTAHVRALEGHVKTIPMNMYTRARMVNHLNMIHDNLRNHTSVRVGFANVKDGIMTVDALLKESETGSLSFSGEFKFHLSRSDRRDKTMTVAHPSIEEALRSLHSLKSWLGQ